MRWWRHTHSCAVIVYRSFGSVRVCLRALVVNGDSELVETPQSNLNERTHKKTDGAHEDCLEWLFGPVHDFVCVRLVVVTGVVGQEVDGVEDRVDEAEDDGVDEVEDPDGRGAQEEIDEDVHRVQCVLHDTHVRVHKI